ncbi:hypothetical protein CW354_14255 [Marinicaulis flavus]|uniref:Uncharacterized protein n=2 Tax=Hyphococcus luteus TaxID=2058213 RepID=A0A2S7K430_9PROT|nr:hypothetical protein CW354_14255 [Marinicaulis flavus]
MPFAVSAPAMAGPIILEATPVFDGSFFEFEAHIADVDVEADGADIAAVRLGRDGGGDYVVFEVVSDVAFALGQGPLGGAHIELLTDERSAIAMGRFSEDQDGSLLPEGNLFVTNLANADAGSPDAAGDFIVYAANSAIPPGEPGGDADEVWLRNLRTGEHVLLREAAAGDVSDVRIADDWIVWNEGDVTLALNVASIGTGTPPTTVRGPVPVTDDAEIDSRFIVWTEQLSEFGFDAETRAQEIGGSSFFVTPDGLDDGFDEIDPATWGDLIAFGLVDRATGLGDIVLADILADTTEIFDLDLGGLSSLALTGEFLTFNALDGGGISQAFLLRIADGALLQLTDGPEGGGVADVFGDLVAYISGRQLFVAKIGEDVAEVPLPPAFAAFGLGFAGFAGLRRRRQRNGSPGSPTAKG